MSILSLAEVAVARDDAQPGTTTRATKRSVPTTSGGLAPAAPAPEGPVTAQPDRTPAAEQTTAETLTSAIPTETLAVYTGVVGIFAASSDSGVANGYLPFRWVAFGAFVALTVVGVWMAYLGKRQQRVARKRGRKSSFPVLEATTAALAAAVWGLVMPGSPLLLQLSGAVRDIAVTTVTLVGSAFVAALSAFLTKGVRKPA